MSTTPSRTKIVHSAWFISLASIGILIGAHAALYTVSFAGLEWLVAGLSLFVCGFSQGKRVGLVCVLLAGILCGLWRASVQLGSQDGYAAHIGSEVVVVGKISADPTTDIDGDVRFTLQNVVIDTQGIGGEVWVSVSSDQSVALRRSDAVAVSGALDKGFGVYPAAMYRATLMGVDSMVFDDPGRDARDWFAKGIRQGIREPEASLGSGFLVGQKTALPEKLDQELRLLGLTHIVVASGYNLSILVRFARRLFFRVSRFSAVALSGLLVYGFLQVTGYSPSMVRAALITGISLAVWYFGRKMHPLVLLPFSAAVTVLLHPSYAWGDLGWMLSFSSFIGVIVLSPLIHAYFWGGESSGALRQVAVETASAQVLTLPIVLYSFGLYSPLALLANILILPFIPVAMLLTFFAGVSGALHETGASIIGWPAETVLGYMTVVVDYLAQSPLASTEVSFSLSAAIVVYVMICVGIIFLWRRTGYEFRDYNIVE